MFYEDILLIDDSKSFCETIVDFLEDEKPQWTIEFVTNGDDALERLQKREYRVVLLDLKMPGMSGLEVLQKLNELELINRNYVIVLTGEITIENAVFSLQHGARDFFQKPSVVEFPKFFLERIERGFAWQKERLVTEKLKQERKIAIRESQLIVKSVGHDMSGSYYGSLMIRLKTLQKRLFKMQKILDEDLRNKLQLLIDCEGHQDVFEKISEMKELLDNGVERTDGVIELMKFFKELGEKLKHLGNAISLDRSHQKRVDLSGVVLSAAQVFHDNRHHDHPNLEIVENYALEPLDILASEEDLFRVFLNLMENALKAMDGEGTLTLRTFLQEGNIFAEVEDTGCGIPEDKLEAIWRPDYTSWKNANGTGLGLLICRKAVENSGGSIIVNSTVNKGTTFTLEFTPIES